MNIKIVTYNIHHGLQLKRIVENITKLSKDGVNIFCLQEVREFNKKSSVLLELSRALGDGWKYEVFLEPNNYNFGLCVFWKSSIFKVKKVERIILPRIPKYNIRVMVKGIRQTIDRGVLVVTFRTKGKLIRISNVHLDCHGQFIQRERQVKYLVHHLKSRVPIKKEIICGDFNTIGAEALSQKQEKKILDILGTGFKNAYSKRTPTFRLLQRLDYIFVKNLKVITSKVWKIKGSDHFPLIAEVEV